MCGNQNLWKREQTALKTKKDTKQHWYHILDDQQATSTNIYIYIYIIIIIKKKKKYIIVLLIKTFSLHLYVYNFFNCFFSSH